MSTNVKNLDSVFEKAKAGDIGSIKACLDSRIPLYALPCMVICYNKNIDHPDVIERIQAWGDCGIEALGRTIGEYASFVATALKNGNTPNNS